MSRPIALPSVVAAALQRGAALAVSISGGKDSQAMLEALAREHKRQRWPGPIHAIHADLGKAEWAETPGHVRFTCDRAGVPLTVVRRRQGDLVDEIHARVKTLAGSAPAWPSSTARYCTADQKREPIDKVLRATPWPTSTQRYCTADQKRDQLLKQQRTLGSLVITAMGMRAQEGCRVCRKAMDRDLPIGPHQHVSKRAKRPIASIATRLTAKRLRAMPIEDALDDIRPGERLVIEWQPIHEWDEAEDVWPTLGYTMEDVQRRRALSRAGKPDEAIAGWTAHPAYAWGNVRLSCALCILACRSDLENGARRNPALFREYIKIELETGFTFQPEFALADLDAARELAPDLIGDRTRQHTLF